MKKKLVFRAWSYFRVGYAQYFSFILAMFNMLTTTYYLAIKDDPAINTIFPNFSIYVLISSIVGIPLLVIVGFLHMKKSPAFSADQDILWESFPYSYKLSPGIQKECIAPLYLELLKLGRKSLSAEKLTPEELKQLQTFENKLDLIAKGGSLSIPKKFDEIR